MGDGLVQAGAGREIAGAIEAAIGGQRVRLMPSRTAFWMERRTLLVADLHLGKSETFGAAGIPMPAGMLERQLEVLRGAIEQAGATRVVIVGDLLHAPAGLTPGLVEAVAGWRSGIGAEVVVVPGNHDRKLTELAGRWDLTVTDWEWSDGPFTFRHEPPSDPPPGQYTWCGHLHPAVRLRAGGDSLKLPCFHVGVRRAVLPAFSPFTAGGPLPRGPGDRLFAIAHDRVVGL